MFRCVIGRPLCASVRCVEEPGDDLRLPHDRGGEDGLGLAEEGRSRWKRLAVLVAVAQSRSRAEAQAA